MTRAHGKPCASGFWLGAILFLYRFITRPKRPQGFEDILFSGKEGRKNEREEQQEYKDCQQEPAVREALENRPHREIPGQGSCFRERERTVPYAVLP